MPFLCSRRRINCFVPCFNRYWITIRTHSLLWLSPSPCIFWHTIKINLAHCTIMHFHVQHLVVKGFHFGLTVLTNLLGTAFRVGVVSVFYGSPGFGISDILSIFRLFYHVCTAVIVCAQQGCFWLPFFRNAYILLVIFSRLSC